MRVMLVTAAVFFASMSAGPASAEGGAIAVEVRVEGNDNSGGGFSIAVLPADIEQPLSLEDLREFGFSTEDGLLIVEDVAPGDYLVVMVVSLSQLVEPAPASVEVMGPGWTCGATTVACVEPESDTGRMPAFDVQVTEGEQVDVTFVRAPYPELAPDFVIPGTGGGIPESATSVPALPDPATAISPPITGDAGMR